MSKVSRRASLLQPLLFATALPLGLLAPGAMSAHAGTVTVTGANGANGHGYYLAGAGQSATATTTTPSDPSNTATAIGGNGGSVPFCSIPSDCVGGRGGNGGAANSTATTWIGSGARSAEATSFGGSGGNGKGWNFPAPGGNGGAASSDASASSTTGSASATANSTGGHGGAYWGNHGGAASSNAAASSTTGSASATASSTGGAAWGPGGASGAAQAYATGMALTGNVQASASANGGGGATGTAFAQSEAKNASGEALTTASAPGGSVRAVSDFTVGSGPEPPAAIVAGWVVSDAKRTLTGSVIGYGAMSAGSGESGAATSLFDLSTTGSEALDLNLLSDSFLGNSDTVELQVVAGGKTTTYDFSNSTFPKQLRLGAIAAGNQTVSLSFDLKGGNGFGFTYDFAAAPVATAFGLGMASPSIPEPSTWAMMLAGFAGLAFAGYRARTGAARRQQDMT